MKQPTPAELRELVGAIEPATCPVVRFLEGNDPEYIPILASLLRTASTTTSTAMQILRSLGIDRKHHGFVGRHREGRCDDCEAYFAAHAIDTKNA